MEIVLRNGDDLKKWQILFIFTCDMLKMITNTNKINLTFCFSGYGRSKAEGMINILPA